MDRRNKKYWKETTYITELEESGEKLYCRWKSAIRIYIETLWEREWPNRKRGGVDFGEKEGTAGNKKWGLGLPKLTTLCAQGCSPGLGSFLFYFLFFIF